MIRHPQNKSLVNSRITGLLQRYWRLASSAVIAAVVVLGSGLLILDSIKTYRGNSPSLARDDRRIASEDAILRDYIKLYGAEGAIMAIKALPGVDCHQRVHKVGRMAYELTNTEAFKVLNSECMSGYTHGVTEAFFHEKGTENLNNNVALICNNEQNGFYAHQCYHGIGHGLMAYTDYSLLDALKMCDTLPPRSTNRESCYSGAFMENVVGAIAVDVAKSNTSPGDFHVSSYLSNDPLYPCNAVDIKYKNTCYFFQSSRMIQIFGQDFKKVTTACESVEAIYQSTCFMSAGRDISNSYGTDYSQIELMCSHTKMDYLRASCIAGAAQDKFWHESEQDDALALCKVLSVTFKPRCYSELSSRAQDIISSQEGLQIFCDKYEPGYSFTCSASL